MNRAGTMPAEERRAPTEDAVSAVGVSDAPKARGVIVASLTHSVVAPMNVFLIMLGALVFAVSFGIVERRLKKDAR